MSRFAHTDSIEIARPPEDVYRLVSDVTRTGEWSPVCESCWWDDGDGPRVGAHFTGRNSSGGRTWETRSQVVRAEPGRAFAWEVNGGLVAWAYTLEPTAGGTRLTESWDFPEVGREFFRSKYGDAAETQIAERVQAAHAGIPATLATLKAILESG